MSEFGNAAAEIFNELWPAMGRPQCKIYAPIAEWTLTAGNTFSAITDTFVDGDGDPVTQSYSAQPSVTADYVPTGARNPMLMMVPGMAQVNDLALVLRWTSTVDDALDDAWAVEVPSGSGKLYRVTSRSYAPDGVVSPSLIQLGLVERG